LAHIPRPPTPTLFPYTTLFRSVRAGQAAPELHAPRDGLLRRGRADLGPALGSRGHRDAPRGARLTTDRERSAAGVRRGVAVLLLDRKSTRLNSSHVEISYAVFC